MPCRYDDYEPTVSKSAYEAMHRELDHVTQLLCYCCGTMQGKDADINWSLPVPPELVEWFKKHHEADTKRVMKQMLDTLARKKLPFVTNSAEADLAGMFMDAAKKVHPVSKFHEQWFFDMSKQAWEIYSKARKQKETKQETVERALAKLTIAERKALGLK